MTRHTSQDLTYTCHQYGSHSLQQLGTWEFSSQRSVGYWLIFIHGGAWRDPTNTHRDFEPSIRAILKDDQINPARVRGFASIDYRLSRDTSPPGPELPARHPDHVSDVRQALGYITRRYNLQDDDYILLGHSAGATLAMQTLMASAALPGRSIQTLPQPAAVLGLAGIYDLPGLIRRHEDYTSFVVAAFGDDRDAWRTASPACFRGNFADTWSRERPLWLGWSPQDSLIDQGEIDSMAAKARDDGLALTLICDLYGDHDDLWKEGIQISALIRRLLQRLHASGSKSVDS